MNKPSALTGCIVEESTLFTLTELCRACGKPAEWVLSLVEENVIEPVSDDPGDWKFRGHCLRRVRIVQRLESDLGLNLAGAALALELLEELEVLRTRIAALDR